MKLVLLWSSQRKKNSPFLFCHFHFTSLLFFAVWKEQAFIFLRDWERGCVAEDDELGSVFSSSFIFLLSVKALVSKIHIPAYFQVFLVTLFASVNWLVCILCVWADNILSYTQNVDRQGEEGKKYVGFLPLGRSMPFLLFFLSLLTYLTRASPSSTKSKWSEQPGKKKLLMEVVCFRTRKNFQEWYYIPTTLQIWGIIEIG